MADRLRVFDAQVGFQLAFMGLRTMPIFATDHPAAALLPLLPVLFALTALAVGMMGLLARIFGYRATQGAGHHAKQTAADLVPWQGLIALHEPALRSMIERRAAAPSRAPPSCRHLVGLMVSQLFGRAVPSSQFDGQFDGCAPFRA